MKAHFENSVRKLTGKQDFTLSDRDFEIFLQKTKGMVFEAGTFEQAVAFVAIAVYDKAEFIRQRARRDTDLPLIADAFVYGYRNMNDDVTITSLIRSKLEPYGFIANAVIMAEEYTVAMDMIFPKEVDQAAIEKTSATIH